MLPTSTALYASVQFILLNQPGAVRLLSRCCRRWKSSKSPTIAGQLFIFHVCALGQLRALKRIGHDLFYPLSDTSLTLPLRLRGTLEGNRKMRVGGALVVRVVEISSLKATGAFADQQCLQTRV